MNILRKDLMLKGKGETLQYATSAFVYLLPFPSHHGAHSFSSSLTRVRAIFKLILNTSFLTPFYLNRLQIPENPSQGCYGAVSHMFSYTS